MIDDRTKLKKMATEVVNLENKYDSSMRGIYLDTLVTEYVNVKAGELIEMYDLISTTLKEGERESFGDADTAATIFPSEVLSKVENSLVNYKVTTSGLYLEDIFCGLNFVVIKIETNYGTEERPYCKIDFHIRRANKSYKKIPHKLINYGDSRDEGYCVSLKLRRDEDIEVVDNRGMLTYYRAFNEAFRALREITLELKERTK